MERVIRVEPIAFSEDLSTQRDKLKRKLVCKLDAISEEIATGLLALRLTHDHFFYVKHEGASLSELRPVS